MGGTVPVGINTGSCFYAFGFDQHFSTVEFDRAAIIITCGISNRNNTGISAAAGGMQFGAVGVEFYGCTVKSRYSRILFGITACVVDHGLTACQLRCSSGSTTSIKDINYLFVAAVDPVDFVKNSRTIRQSDLLVGAYLGSKSSRQQRCLPCIHAGHGKYSV